MGLLPNFLWNLQEEGISVDIWKDEWHWTPYRQDKSSPWLILTACGGRGKPTEMIKRHEAASKIDSRRMRDQKRERDKTKYSGRNNSRAREVTSTSTRHNEPLHLPGAPCRVSRHHRGWQQAMLCGGWSSQIDSLQTTPSCLVRHVPRCYMQSLAGVKLWSRCCIYFVRLPVSLYSNTSKALPLVLWKGPGSEMWLMKGLCKHYRCNPFKIRPHSEQKNRNEARHPDAWSKRIQPRTSLWGSHPLPVYIIPLQIDKGTREPMGTVIQYWNLTVSDQIWWTVILSSLPRPDGLQYRIAPSERSVRHCSMLPHTPTPTPIRMNEGIDERLGFEGRD